MGFFICSVLWLDLFKSNHLPVTRFTGKFFLLHSVVSQSDEKNRQISGYYVHPSSSFITPLIPSARQAVSVKEEKETGRMGLEMNAI